MTSQPKPGTAGEESGFIIVAVLWMLGTLSVLASIYAAYVIVTAREAKYQDGNLEAPALARAAVELVALNQLSYPPSSGPSGGDFQLQLGNATISVHYVSELGRIDLNTAPAALIKGLMLNLGAPEAEAERYTRQIVARRSPPTSENAKDTAPGEFKYQSTLELSQVPGLPAGWVRRLLQYVTVYSGNTKIGVLVADPAVLSAMPGMTRDRSNAFVAARAANDRDVTALSRILGPAAAFATFESGRIFRVDVSSSMKGGIDNKSEIVIVVFNEGPQPYSILSWHDLADGAGG